MQASLRSLRKLGCALPVSKDGRPRSGLVVETRRCATLLTMRARTQVPTRISAFRRCPTSACRHPAREQSREPSCQRAEQAWTAYGGHRLPPDPRIDGPHLSVVRLPEVVCDEAQVLIPYISHGPLIFWLYPVFGIRGASWFLGVSEWLIGALLFLGFWDSGSASSARLARLPRSS